MEREIEELKERQKNEQDSWMREKGDLLRKLAEMRKLHIRDRRRIEDVLAAVWFRKSNFAVNRVLFVKIKFLLISICTECRKCKILA